MHKEIIRKAKTKENLMLREWKWLNPKTRKFVKQLDKLRSRCSRSQKITKLNLECPYILNFWSGNFGHQIQPAKSFLKFLLNFVFFDFFDFFDWFFCGNNFFIFNHSAKNMYVKFQINRTMFTHSNEFFLNNFSG